jgi:phosphinothricin acetyltransferase
VEAIEIRAVTPGDIPAIHNIYYASVTHDTASWELVPPDEDEMRSRAEALLAQGFPYFVAVCDGRVVGYCYASSFRTRPGYRYTVEDSVYVDGAHQRLGIARQLLGVLIDACTAKGYRQMVAVIGGSERIASIALHQKLGFEQVGLLPNLGLKHGRWLDCVLMQRALGEGHATIPTA